jgi:hypothetical protein
MTERDRAHALIDTLPEDELRVARRFLEFLGAENPSPLLRALRDAPLDDEPLTAEDRAALEEGERDWAEGRVVSHEEARSQQAAASMMHIVPVLP